MSIPTPGDGGINLNFLQVVPCKDHGTYPCCCLAVAAARREALLDAVSMCNQVGLMSDVAALGTAEHCAEAIRSLIDKEPTT